MNDNGARTTKRHPATVVLVGALLAALWQATPAVATASDLETDAERAAAAVEALMDDPSADIAEPEPVVGSGTGFSSSTNGGGEIILPEPAVDRIEVITRRSHAAFTISPEFIDAGAASVIDDRIIYPQTRGVALLAAGVDDGLQLLTTISDVSSPTRYRYRLDAPKGTALETTEDGYVIATLSDGTPLFGVRPAWAVDADGNRVSTWYEVEDGSIVQVVRHAGAVGMPLPREDAHRCRWLVGARQATNLGSGDMAQDSRGSGEVGNVDVQLVRSWT